MSKVVMVTEIGNTSTKSGLGKNATRIWGTPQRKAKKAFDVFLQEETRKLKQK